MAKRLGAKEVQQVIYSVLSDIPEITVYDSVPETANMPYIKIGDFSITDEGTKTEHIDRHTVDIEVFSQYKGKKQIEEITDSVYQILSSVNVKQGPFYIRFMGIDSELNQVDDDIYQASITVDFIVEQGE